MDNKRKRNDRTLLMRPVAQKERGYKEMKKKRSASCKDKNTGELLTKKPQLVK